MKKLILTFATVALCACSQFYPIPAEAHSPAALEGSVVIVHLDNNTGLVQGTLVDITLKGVLVRLSNSKLYFYPMSRISGIEQL